MSKARFDKAFAAFVRRGEEKMDSKTFFQILAELEKERVQRTIELHARVVGSKLQFEPSRDLQVHDNEIVVGDQRIVVKVS